MVLVLARGNEGFLWNFMPVSVDKYARWWYFLSEHFVANEMPG